MLLNLCMVQDTDTSEKTAVQYIGLGFLSFDKLIETNLISDLKSGIYNFIRGFELCKDNTDVIERFDDVFYLPVKDSICENYNRNISYFGNTDNLSLPSCESLHVYVVNNEEFFCYNFLSETFLYHGKWSCIDYIAAMMMIESAENLEKDKFFMATLNFARKVFSHRNAIRELNRKIEKGNFEGIDNFQDEFSRDSGVGQGALDYCYAKYYYETKQYSLALQSISLALQYSRITSHYNLLAGKILFELNEGKKSLFYLMRAVAVDDKNNSNYTSNLPQTLLDNAEPAQKADLLFAASLAFTNPCFFPGINTMTFDNHHLETALDFLENTFFDIMRFELPLFVNQTDSPFKLMISNCSTGYRGSSYDIDKAICNTKYELIFHLLKRELVKFRLAKNCFAEHCGCDYVLPVLSHSNQIVNLSYGDQRKSTGIYHNNIEYYRINQDINISAADTIFIGKPIYLVHSHNRKKLIANVFVDSLTMNYLLKTDFKSAPNIKKFFGQGIIFANTYSTAEHTIPSLPSIKTGCYPHKTQIFERCIMLSLDDNIKLFADYFSNAGYHCADFTCDTEEPYFNTCRSMDKVVCQFGSNYPIEKIVSDALDHIKAFSETDNYIEISVDTPHRILENLRKDLALQVKEPVVDISFLDNDAPSVWQTKSTEKEYAYEYAIKNVNSELGRLFDYITKNYNDDEFVVTLFSDHGTPILDDHKWLLEKDQTNSCFMIRGGGIAPCGIYDNEIVSALDILPSVLNACNIQAAENIDGVLPRILGGTGRDYVITQSVFGGQTYKISIRTLTNEFRFESNTLTTIDGKIDTENGSYTLLDSKTNQPYYDEKMIKYFLSIVREHTKTRQIADEIT